MKIALIGATGNAGSRILAELARRGHAITAIVRNPDKVLALPNVTARRGDVFDPAGLAAVLTGHDAVISAVHFTASDPAGLIDAVRRSGVGRYLVMGGAGSLLVAPGVRLVDTPTFPAAYQAEALKGAEFLELLRDVRDLDWTFLSPSALLVPGQRTGQFRLGADELLTDGAGNSTISFEDLAVALVDELERPAHSRSRFTAGY